jgi:hypothetical protein
MIYVCREEDAFLEDKPLWFVDLNNNERIWMDDGRPGISPPQAWLRLRDYLDETSASIVRMYIKFRSHLELPLPDNAPGYFFCNKAFAIWGSSDTIHSFMIGFFDGEGIHIQEWQVPTLIQTGFDYRLPSQLKEPACLIVNKGITYGKIKG